MAENNYVERQRVVRERSSGSLVFIVGGLVVAVAFIIWLFASGDSWSNYSAPTTGDTTNEIDNTAPDATAPATDIEPVPVPEADTTAPAADVEPAPATDVDAAPATDADTSVAPAEPTPAEPAPAD